jgi:trigger factor
MAVHVEQEQHEHDHCRVTLNIDVPPEEIKKATDSVFNQFAKRTNIPGFRPGKAPKHLVQRFIDEGRVREMAMEQALTNAYRDALRQSGVEPYRFAEPQVELPEEELDPEKGFRFKATVALPPHVHLGDLEGLTGRRVVTKITDEDVDRELGRLLEQGATFEPADDVAQDGDRVRATIEVAVDGQPVPEASFSEPTLLQVGTNLPEFDAGLTGAKAGEEKSFEFTFPEDYPNEELRGKTAQGKVAAIEVQRRTVPEASDEFAKRAGFDTLDALKQAVRDAMERQAEGLAERELNESLLKELIGRSTVHFPEEMAERQVSSRMNDLLQALERRGMTLDDYLESEKKDLAALQTELREDAIQGLSNTLVLLNYAEVEGIQVSEKEVEQEIKRRADAENVKTSQMRKLMNDTGEIDVVRHNILYAKVAASLRDKAEIRELEG